MDANNQDIAEPSTSHGYKTKKDNIETCVSSSSTTADTSCNKNTASDHETEMKSEVTPIWFVLNKTKGNHTSKCKPCRKHFEKRLKGDFRKLKRTIIVKCVKTREKSASLNLHHSEHQEKGNESQVVKPKPVTEMFTSKSLNQVAEVADTAESPMEVEAIPACIVVETNELVTCGSSAKHPATNISTEEVKIHLGWAGAVNPYGASSFTCKSFPKKSEELLSSLEAQEKKNNKRPSYEDISSCSNQGICSGRTPLSDTILNNTYAIVDGRKYKTRNPEKNQFEEKIYECEDEMFEIDILIQTAESTFHKLQKVYKNLSGMTKSERETFILPDNIDGSSDVLHLKSFKRLFGDNYAESFYNFKHNPFTCIPFVLNLLTEQITELKLKKRNKQVECHEVLKDCYPKSLDYQGKSFRQVDKKFLSTKFLNEEIEDIYNLRISTTVGISNDNQNQAHLVLIYKDKKILYDAADLINHYIKNHSKFDNKEKKYAEHIIFHVVPDIFTYKRQKLSEVEDEYEDPFGCDNEKGIDNEKAISPNYSPSRDKNENLFSEQDNSNQNLDEKYTLFFGNNHWYIFLRLHHILCSRLNNLYEISIASPEETNEQNLNTRDLHLKPKGKINKLDKYKNFLQELKSLLDEQIDYNLYEERIWEIFGISAYIGHTMDIIISSAVDQILNITRNTISKNCIKIMYHQGNDGGSGGPCHNIFQRKEAELLHEAMAKEALADMTSYKIVLYSNNEMKLIIKLLEIKKLQIKLVKGKKKKWRKKK